MERGYGKRVKHEDQAGELSIPPPDPETPVEIDERDFLAFPAVSHQPAHCPNCGSKESHIYKTGHPTHDTTKRYHVCQYVFPNGRKCGAKFRSLEELNRVDFAHEFE